MHERMTGETSSNPRYTIAIVQRRLTAYRVPLFEQLRESLSSKGIRLIVLVGSATEDEQSKQDAGILPWAKHLTTRYWLHGRICWQPFVPHIENADLVIVTQENRLIYNLFALFFPRRFRVAFWGHGRNMQSSNPKSWRERFKRRTLRQADWWFAYTDLSAEIVAEAGYPRDRITVLNNSIDTCELVRLKNAITPIEREQLRARLDLEGAIVGIFIGALYSEKRLDFLIAACERVRRSVPNFRLLVVGDGPEKERVVRLAAAASWITWLGARFGREKALYASLAHMQLNPGAVGLGILDAFVFGIPLVTTDTRTHGPEIAYLKPGENGVMSADSVSAYAMEIIRVAHDRALLERLCQGSADSMRNYSLSLMAKRFTDGIVTALTRPTMTQVRASQ